MPHCIKGMNSINMLTEHLAISSEMVGSSQAEVQKQLVGAVSVVGIDLEFNNFGVDFLVFFVDIELTCGKEAKLNVFHFEILIEFRHSVTAG